MQYRGKHVVITGGAGGIGSLLSKAFLDEGAGLTIVDRCESTAFEGVAHIKGDLSSFEGIQAVCEILSRQHVDILVNLAGMQYFGPFEYESPEHVYRLYMVNLVAPALLAQAVLPSMKARKQGHIVNIGSTFGSINFAHFVAYSSSKAGMKGLSEALRREVSADGVKVTYISPRAVDTPLNNEKVIEFARETKMNMDTPEYVVSKIMHAINKQAKDVYIGFPESLFVRINAVLPRIVDKALAADDKKARTLFQ